MAAVEEVRRAFGFCAEHMDVLATTADYRKHENRYRHEPKGSERASWLRATFMTAGWPPPGQSAAEPERQSSQPRRDQE